MSTVNARLLDADSFVFRERDSWTNKPEPGYVQGPPDDLYIHFTGGVYGGYRREADALRIMREIDRQHSTGKQDYKGLGYSFVLFQTVRGWKVPRIYEGRGFRRVPASQKGCNRGNIPLCVVASESTLIRSSTAKAIADFFDLSTCEDIFGHRECPEVKRLGGTDCPGAQLMEVVKTIRSNRR